MTLTVNLNVYSFYFLLQLKNQSRCKLQLDPAARINDVCGCACWAMLNWLYGRNKVAILWYVSYGNEMLHRERVFDQLSEDEIKHGELEGRAWFLGELNRETLIMPQRNKWWVHRALMPFSEFQIFCVMKWVIFNGVGVEGFFEALPLKESGP